MSEMYKMSDGNGGCVFDENSQAGRDFITWANEIADAHDDSRDPLIYDKTELAEDGVAEAFYHDSKNVYFVRDEPGASLEYASAR